LFWVAHLVFYATLYGSFQENYRQTFFEELLYLPVRIIFTYFTLYYLLPRFLLTGKYGEFALWFLGSSFLAGTLQRYFSYNYYYPIYYPQALADPFFYFPKIVKMFVMIYPVTFTATAIKLLKYWYTNQKAQQVLKEEKLQAELKFLKTQIHPHFLFNTLNNIYSLSRDKSDLAPESILRLSKILRYMLYETSGPYIAIEQDLKIIDDYIALEKLRYDDSLRMYFNYDLEDIRQSLPPLLLMPLVENAFKHGVSETRDRPYVDIHLSIKNRQLLFVVKNSTGDPAGDNKAKMSIGLSNLRRQLELLYTDYQLDVQQGDYMFTATLKINLASHV